MARRKKQNEDESSENGDNLNNEADDTFGLPEVQYEPLNRDEPASEQVTEQPVPDPQEESHEWKEEPVVSGYGHQSGHEEHVTRDEPTYQYRYQQEQESSPWGKIIVVLLVILLAGGAAFYFAYWKPKQKEEEARRIETVEAEKRAEAERLERERLAELARQAEQRKADSLAAIPTEGTIETLSSRTGQYYVVVASALDDDLLMDYANRLIKEGKQVKIIPPFGKAKLHRLAIDAKETYADAQGAADSMKGGEFGDQIWVLRY